MEARRSAREGCAHPVAKIIRSPALHRRGNIGVDKPGTDADKPCFMQGGIEEEAVNLSLGMN